MPDSDTSGLDAIDAIPETDAPPAETPAPAETQTPPEPSTGAPPRDDAGRFTKQAPQAAPAAAKEAATEQSPETPGEPQPEAEPTGEAQYERFAVRADGQDLTDLFPDSAVGEEGVFFGPQSLPVLTRLIQEGIAHRGSFRQRLSESAQKEQAAAQRAEAAEAQAQAIITALDQVFTGEEQAVLDFINGYRNEWPVLKAKSEAARYKVQAEALSAREKELNAEREHAAQRPMMYQGLQNWVVSIGREVGLEDQDIRVLYEELADPELESVVFRQAPEDDWESGLRKGELAANLALIRQRAMTLQRVVTRYRTPTQTGAKAPAPKPKVPPSVSAKGGPAPGVPKKKLPEFKNQREADEYVFDHLEEFAGET